MQTREVNRVGMLLGAAEGRGVSAVGDEPRPPTQEYSVLVG